MEFGDTRVGRVPARTGQEDREEQGEKAKKSQFQNVLFKKWKHIYKNVKFTWCFLPHAVFLRACHGATSTDAAFKFNNTASDSERLVCSQLSARCWADSSISVTISSLKKWLFFLKKSMHRFIHIQWGRICPLLECHTNAWYTYTHQQKVLACSDWKQNGLSQRSHKDHFLKKMHMCKGVLNSSEQKGNFYVSYFEKGKELTSITTLKETS